MAEGSKEVKFDSCFDKTVNAVVESIKKITSRTKIKPVTFEELKNAISMSSIYKGKAADIYENIQHTGDTFKHKFLEHINKIFKGSHVPDYLKLGLFTPIFKIKRKNNNAAN